MSRVFPVGQMKRISDLSLRDFSDDFSEEFASSLTRRTLFASLAVCASLQLRPPRYSSGPLPQSMDARLRLSTLLFQILFNFDGVYGYQSVDIE